MNLVELNWKIISVRGQPSLFKPAISIFSLFIYSFN